VEKILKILFLVQVHFQMYRLAVTMVT